MPHPRYTPNEMGERGEALYEARIRAAVEPEHVGRFVVVDVDTGEYQLTDDHYETARQMQTAARDRPLYAIRIGYRFVARIRGCRPYQATRNGVATDASALTRRHRSAR